MLVLFSLFFPQIVDSFNYTKYDVADQLAPARADGIILYAGHSSALPAKLGQLAQGLARFVDIEEVTGSNPVLPTTYNGLA